MSDPNGHIPIPAAAPAAARKRRRGRATATMRRLRVRSRVLWIAVVGLVAACGATAGSATGKVPKNFYGIIPLTALDGTDFAKMGRAHVGSLRIQVSWPIIEPSRNGPFDWSQIDPLVAGAASMHISLLPTLIGTPGWVATTANGSQIKIGSQFQRNAWKGFVRAAAKRYGPHGTFWSEHPQLRPDPVTRWQIWNEENNPIQKNPPKTYGKLLALSDHAISSVDKKAKIYTGGMFGTPPAKKGGITAWRYVKILLQHGAGKHLNGVSLHPYAKSIKELKFPIEKVRAVLKKHHRAGLEILITEIGWGSSKKKYPGTGSRGAVFNVGPKKQKQNLTNSFKVLTRHRQVWKIGGVFWFTWKDPLNPPPGLCAFCYSSGLYHADGTTPKPALSAYKDFTRKTR